MRLRLLSLMLLLAVGLQSTPAHALRNRTIILRAAGSGAILGLGAGLISYPFASSTKTIFAGVLVGGILGAVYGFHLIDERDEAYRRVERNMALENFGADRNLALAQAKTGKARPSLEVGVPLAFFTFDLR